MTHTTLRFVTLKDDPSEQVIWNQERPIAYLNKADASIDELIELENLIQQAPAMLEALKEIAKGEGAYSRDALVHASNTIDNMKRIANEAIHKVEPIDDLIKGLERAADLWDDVQERKAAGKNNE